MVPDCSKEEMIIFLKNFIEAYEGTAIGYSMKNRLDNMDLDNNAEESPYLRDLYEEAYLY